jgi:hypothetical protein
VEERAFYIAENEDGLSSALELSKEMEDSKTFNTWLLWGGLGVGAVVLVLFLRQRGIVFSS